MYNKLSQSRPGFGSASKEAVPVFMERGQYFFQASANRRLWSTTPGEEVPPANRPVFVRDFRFDRPDEHAYTPEVLFARTELSAVAFIRIS